MALPAEQVALAAVMEEGTRLFYQGLAELFDHRSERKIFRDLAASETKHKETLASVYEKLTVRPVGADFPVGIIEAPPMDTMEGGMRVSEALEWAARRDFGAALELGIAVEVQALDRYLILQRELTDEQGRRVFAQLAHAEREHLRQLSDLLGKSIS